MKSTQTCANHLADSIMVQAPYNVLYDISLSDDNQLAGKVRNEYLASMEAGPIGVAEAGRHLAILGSMLLAHEYQFNESCYYLAKQAKLRRCSESESESDYLQLSVSPTSIDKRTAKLQGEVFNDSNQLIFLIEVDYQVIRKNIFYKIFKDQFTETESTGWISPYREDRRKFNSVTVAGETAQAEYGTVLAMECQGHFSNYPCLPVAIIGNLFIELAIQLFTHSTTSHFDKIIALNTTIQAHRLVFAGESISFYAQIKQSPTPSSKVICTEARVNGEVVSNAEIELSGIPHPFPERFSETAQMQ